MKAPLAASLLVALALVPAASAGTRTIKVTSVSISYKTTDKPPKGPSKGDTIVYRDRLLNAVAQFGRKQGAVVGSDHGTMTFTSAHSARFDGLAVLPGGTLTLSGNVLAVTATSFAIPVTAGTGRFAGAKGYLVVGPGKKKSSATPTRSRFRRSRWPNGLRSGTMGEVSRPLLLTLVVLAVAFVPAAQASTQFTMVLTSYTTVTQTHDTPPKGKANKGDSIDFKDLLVTTTNNELGKKKDKPVGYDAGTVLYTSATASKIEGITTFPGVGTLKFEGPMLARKDGTVHLARHQAAPASFKERRAR